jgi:hypothetical protein
MNTAMDLNGSDSNIGTADTVRPTRTRKPKAPTDLAELRKASRLALEQAGKTQAALVAAAHSRKAALVAELAEVDALLGELEEGPAPAPSKPAKRPATPARTTRPPKSKTRQKAARAPRKAPADPDLVARVVQAVRDAAAPVSLAEAASLVTDASREDVAKALKAAVGSGEIVSSGKARGMRYSGHAGEGSE